MDERAKARAKRFGKFKQPQSFCVCTHLGDGPASPHTGAVGHGYCVLCKCDKFAWKEHTAEYTAHLKRSEQ